VLTTAPPRPVHMRRAQATSCRSSVPAISLLIQGALRARERGHGHEDLFVCIFLTRLIRPTSTTSSTEDPGYCTYAILSAESHEFTIRRRGGVQGPECKPCKMCDTGKGSARTNEAMTRNQTSSMTMSGQDTRSPEDSRERGQAGRRGGECTSGCQYTEKPFLSKGRDREHELSSP